MGAQSIPAPITLAQYERVPDPPGGRYELHHGELVFAAYPVHQHKALQRRLRKLLEPMAEPGGFIVDTEYPYRPIPEHKCGERMWPASAKSGTSPRGSG